jgi:hypothetical protein
VCVVVRARTVFFQIYQLVDIFTVRVFASPDAAPSSWLTEAILVELTGITWLPYLLIAVKARRAPRPPDRTRPRAHAPTR